MRKAAEDQMPSQDTIEADIIEINRAIDDFAAAMKVAMAKKAREGRYGWNDPSLRGEIYSNMLAHAVVAEHSPGHEIHAGNFAMMLYHLNNKK